MNNKNPMPDELTVEEAGGYPYKEGSVLHHVWRYSSPIRMINDVPYRYDLDTLTWKRMDL